MGAGSYRRLRAVNCWGPSLGEDWLRICHTSIVGDTSVMWGRAILKGMRLEAGTGAVGETKEGVSLAHVLEGGCPVGHGGQHSELLAISGGPSAGEEAARAGPEQRLMGHGVPARG